MKLIMVYEITIDDESKAKYIAEELRTEKKTGKFDWRFERVFYDAKILSIDLNPEPQKPTASEKSTDEET